MLDLGAFLTVPPTTYHSETLIIWLLSVFLPSKGKPWSQFLALAVRFRSDSCVQSQFPILPLEDPATSHWCRPRHTILKSWINNTSPKILAILSCIVLGPLGPKKTIFPRLKSLAIVKNVNISQGHLSICAWFAYPLESICLQCWETCQVPKLDSTLTVRQFLCHHLHGPLRPLRLWVQGPNFRPKRLELSRPESRKQNLY